MERSISNLTELQAEINILKLKKYQQEVAIKDSFSSPAAILSTASSLFKGKSGTSKSFLQGLINQDIVSNISQVVLPFIMNKMIFRRSGFITKALIGLVSRKAAKNLNTDKLTGWIIKIKSMFDKKKSSSQKQSDIKDYGIPPYSETY